MHVRCGHCARERGITDQDKRAGILMCYCVSEALSYRDYLILVVVCPEGEP